MEKKIAKVEPDGVKEIMEIFYKVNPTLNWGNRTYRSSAAMLIKKFGLEEITTMAQIAVSIQGKPYAPTVTNPYELKEKLYKVKLFFDRQNNQTEMLSV